MSSLAISPFFAPGGISPHTRFTLKPGFSVLSRKKNARLKKRGKAATLMEFLLWTAGVVGVLALAFVTYNAFTNSFIANKQAQHFSTMMADARSIYANQGNFNGVNPSVMINLGIVPSTMVRNDTIIAEGWNTIVDVTPTNLNGTAGDGIEFSYTLPRTMCAKFATSGSQTAARVTVDGTVVKNVTTGNNNLDVTQLQAACQSTAGGNVVILLAQGR